jgi:hypothetical protein
MQRGARAANAGSEVVVVGAKIRAPSLPGRLVKDRRDSTLFCELRPQCRGPIKLKRLGEKGHHALGTAQAFRPE